MKKALIVYGGWDGHAPDQVADMFKSLLQDAGITVTLSETLAVFDDGAALQNYDLIVPIWTDGTLSRDAATNVSEAVARGTGLAGCHGGMCDAFRASPLWQFMTGANWVGHPGGDGVGYRVRITSDDPLVEGIPDFDVSSELYYLHIDPANRVLAKTSTKAIDWYHSPNGPVDMPVAWTRSWGLGRVYYNALGHQPDVINQGPAYEMLRRGLLWAADSKASAKGGDLSPLMTPGNHW